MPAYFGLDIGSSSIKVVEMAGNNVSVAGMAVNPAGKVGVDLIPAEQTALLEAVKGLITQQKLRLKKVVLGVPESLVYTRILSFPFMSSPELATAVRWEIEQTIPYPLEKLELSWEVMYKPRSAVSGEKMKVLVVAVPNKVANAYVSFMDTLGLEIVRLENELVALVRNVMFKRRLPEVDMVVDIGFSTTKMAVMDVGQIYANYVSPVAGLALTRIISDAFRLAIPQAEEYKRAYGLEKGQFEGKLLAAVEPVLTTLLADIKKVIASYNNSYPERKLERVILLGGGAFTRGLVPLLVEQTGLEVVLGNAFEGLKVPAAAAGLGTVFAVATGLAMEVA